MAIAAVALTAATQQRARRCRWRPGRVPSAKYASENLDRGARRPRRRPSAAAASMAVAASAAAAVGGFRGGFHGGGIRSGGFAYRGGGYRAAHIYRGGGYRYSGLRYGGDRHAYHRPFVHRRHFHRRFYAPYTIPIRATIRVAGSSGPTTVRARSARWRYNHWAYRPVPASTGEMTGHQLKRNRRPCGRLFFIAVWIGSLNPRSRTSRTSS